MNMSDLEDLAAFWARDIDEDQLEAEEPLYRFTLNGLRCLIDEVQRNEN